MHVRLEKDRLVLTLNLLESRILLRVFEELLRDYRLQPAEVDPDIAAVWYSTRGCAAARMNDAETREWVSHLQALKAARVVQLEGWAGQLSGSRLESYTLEAGVEHADLFLASINDYRLAMASRHAIGQREMDLHDVEEWTSLSAARRSALFEIHFLAVLMEEVLREVTRRDSSA